MRAAPSVRCGQCNRKGGMHAVERFAGNKVAGSFCNKCGFFLADRVHKVAELFCECGDAMGRLAVEQPVVIEGKVHRAARALKDYFCPKCSQARIEAGTHDPDTTMTRHTVLCTGGCGKVQGWVDVEEGDPLLDHMKTIGSCDGCTERVQEIKRNEKALDAGVKAAASQVGW